MRPMTTDRAWRKGLRDEERRLERRRDAARRARRRRLHEIDAGTEHRPTLRIA